MLSLSNRKRTSERFYSAELCREGFVISYTHSVNKGRVHDFYRAVNGALLLEKTEFVSYGAGIPEPDEIPGAIWSVTESGYFISGLNRKIPRLVMAVGITARHSIAEGRVFSPKTEELFLTDYFPPQTSLILQIKRVPIVEYMTHRLNHL